EREEIAIMHAKDKGVRKIARILGRDPGTISRELRRNAARRSGKQEYRALVAQWKAQQAAKRAKAAKLVTNDQLREYVQDSLDGSVKRADGTVVAGPVTGGDGRAGASRTGRIVGGRRRGAQSRSLTGLRSISLMMSPCVSVTRRSTSRCLSRGV